MLRAGFRGYGFRITLIFLKCLIVFLCGVSSEKSRLSENVCQANLNWKDIYSNQCSATNNSNRAATGKIFNQHSKLKRIMVVLTKNFFLACPRSMVS